MIMDLASEMPAPNFQYYVQDALQGGDLALGLIGFAGFLGMASVTSPGGYLARALQTRKDISVRGI